MVILYTIIFAIAVTLIVWLLVSHKEQTRIINPQVHKQALLVMYKQASVNPSPFEKFLFDEAIRKLNSDVSPHIVENWVVDVEKAWRK